MVLCTTMKPNSKFSGNFFGLDIREGIEHLEWMCQVCVYNVLASYNFVYLYSTLHSLQVQKTIGQELFERKLVVQFCFIIEEMVLH